MSEHDKGGITAALYRTDLRVTRSLGFRHADFAVVRLGLTRTTATESREIARENELRSRK